MGSRLCLPGALLAALLPEGPPAIEGWWWCQLGRRLGRLCPCSGCGDPWRCLPGYVGAGPIDDYAKAPGLRLQSSLGVLRLRHLWRQRGGKRTGGVEHAVERGAPVRAAGRERKRGPESIPRQPFPAHGHRDVVGGASPRRNPGLEVQDLKAWRALFRGLSAPDQRETGHQQCAGRLLPGAISDRARSVGYSCRSLAPVPQGLRLLWQPEGHEDTSVTWDRVFVQKQMCLRRRDRSCMFRRRRIIDTGSAGGWRAHCSRHGVVGRAGKRAAGRNYQWYRWRKCQQHY
mmetsp:Transcript_65140/g.105349  ORF Transcript_65140/g.105349 Transcript_65140/m.105349 type:complete len:287 (-) Transcript_65140:676-1536(-)